MGGATDASRHYFLRNIDYNTPKSKEENVYNHASKHRQANPWQKQQVSAGVHNFYFYFYKSQNSILIL